MCHPFLRECRLCIIYSTYFLRYNKPVTRIIIPIVNATNKIITTANSKKEKIVFYKKNELYGEE